MQKFLIAGLLIAIIILTGALFFVAGEPTVSTNAPDVGTYCSPDGSLSDVMPIQSHRSYCVKSLSDFGAFKAGEPHEYSFQIVDDQGSVAKDFAITHTKPMHVLIVREDLQHFQHLHPEFHETTGTFTLPDLTFPEAGRYRIFADFAMSGGMMDPSGSLLGITISEIVSIGKGYKPESLGSEVRVKEFGDLQVTLGTSDPLVSGVESTLSFALQADGQPVTDLEEYLGALGHSVILREDSLDFIHVHPVDDIQDAQDGTVEFMTTFPSAGRYKIFTQFQRGEQVMTTDFVVSVESGEGMMEGQGGDPMMGH